MHKPTKCLICNQFSHKNVNLRNMLTHFMKMRSNTNVVFVISFSQKLVFKTQKKFMRLKIHTKLQKPKLQLEMFKKGEN